MIKQLRQRGAHLVDIAHQIGCCERTVQRHLAREAAPTGRPVQPRSSKLDPYKPIIDQLLADNVWNAEVIFQLLREQGYSGGSTMVRMYIQPKRALRPSKRTVRFETQPGFQLQHDWGEIETAVAGPSSVPGKPDPQSTPMPHRGVRSALPCGPPANHGGNSIRIDFSYKA